jgi:hypothetical protein
MMHVKTLNKIPKFQIPNNVKIQTAGRSGFQPRMLPKGIILILSRGGSITGNRIEGSRRLQPASMRKLKLAATPAIAILFTELVVCELAPFDPVP